MKNSFKIICLILCNILFAGMAIPAYAASQYQSSKSFEQVTDEFMEHALLENNVAGAAIAVVENGKVLFEKGYGYADIESKAFVDSESTAFQIASVSKLFTATAVMQMVEQGKLNLDEDVNNYLKAFKVDNSFSNPVTLRMLLTHTSGLDDRMPLYIQSKGDIFFDSIEPLEETLKKYLPPIVRKPGTFCQYNVYGMALAGYLVELASEMTLEKYITQNILDALEMKHSSYGLTKEILPAMAKPYKYKNGEYVQGSYTVINDHPSGSIFTSASDMANFMIAHLNKGNYNDNKILSDESVAQMQTHQYPADNRLLGYGLGFFETVENGNKVIGHNGYLPSFSSRLTLLPDKNIGAFIVINTDSKTSMNLTKEFVELFYDYFTEPKVNTPQKLNVPLNMDPKQISGKYAIDGCGITDLSKIKSVLVTCIAKCDADGNLTLSGNGLNENFKYIGDGLFYSKDNGIYCKVSEQNGKQILNILGGDFEKTDELESTLFAIFLISLPVFLIALIGLLFSCLKNRRNQSRFNLVSKLSFMLQGFLTILYFVLNFMVPILYMIGNTQPIFSIVHPLIRVVCFASLATVVFSVVLVAKMWIKKEVKLRSKLLYSGLLLLTLSNVIFMWLMNGMYIIWS